MTAPRIEVDLGKIRHNTRCLVERLKPRGISVTAVTKAVCGHPEIAQAMLDGGAVGLGEARVRNAERLRKAGITSPITLIRTPMLSQVDQVVRCCDTSYNTEIEVIARLSEAARRAKSVHGIMLMVEMGDMREGIQPESVEALARQVNAMPGVVLKGIGANFACLSDSVPDAAKMTELSTIARSIEKTCGPCIETVSGGNSASLPWAFATQPMCSVNNLRLGEAILLGVEPVSGDAISGLYTNAFSLMAEVIETTAKQLPASGAASDPDAVRRFPDNTHPVRSIIAIGKQDTDISGLTLPEGVSYLGATSDHMVVATPCPPPRVGSMVRFRMNYGALMRAMNAPDIAKFIQGETPLQEPDFAERGINPFSTILSF